MTLHISVSDSGVEDEITQLNLPEIENEEAVIEEEDIEEQRVVGSSRPTSLAWLCFDKSKIYKKNGKEYVKCNQDRCNCELIYNKSTASHLVRHVKKVHACLLPTGEI